MTYPTSYGEKLSELRALMAKEGVDGFLVPRTDEYQGEYVPAGAERLAWLTGFTGSAGLAVILADRAMVMSDGRYTIQLAAQVDQDLYELENSQKVKPEEWLLENTEEGEVIGYDPKLHTPAQIEAKEKSGLILKAVSQNLIDKIWMDKPAPPMEKIVLFPEKYAGQSADKKIDIIRKQMAKNKAEALILTMSDSIAWLLNIRGHDIPHIPVALSYLILPIEGKAKWYVNEKKLTQEVKEALEDIVEFSAEENLAADLAQITETVWLDPKRSSIWFKKILQKAGAKIIAQDDPCIMPRACKNEAEQQAMKAAHIRDGVALVNFLKWFEETNEGQTELSVEEKLESFRAQASEYKEASFSTIAGYGSNGAIVHYRANEKTSKNIEAGSLLLLDSGAQYEDGTTDITRTLAVGSPTDEMKENFTLVLKGHIALASAKFVKGTTGKKLDQLARKPLQDKGLDYAHGTGHGVGCYLSVHEEAASISPRGEEPLRVGMIISNEPGFYKEGEYGIRIENLVLVQEAEDGELYFETITLCPIDKKMIVVDMLDEKEKTWLNEYNARVYETLLPLLDQSTAAWLKEATKAV
ncbi:MAG TPA: aminopeptidase P family protein [Alphaproteobacteria bacterium]|nr:aminopeptidase P family protein [Alphaproteobacteria bacterium]